MNDYRHPPTPDPTPEERRFQRWWLALRILLAVLVIAALYGILTATVFRAEAAPARPATMTVPGYAVGEFHEPPQHILTRINGRETIRLKHLWLKGKSIEVPVTELKLVSPTTKTTTFGNCVGNQAVRQGNARTRNRIFLRQWRVACAAFCAYCQRHCGRTGMSFAVRTQYAQVRKRGARIIASKVSTKYAPYYKWFKKGDLFFFHKAGGLMGHMEICIGGGWTVGTSSSAGYVAKRRVGNRGFKLMSVIRL